MVRLCPPVGEEGVGLPREDSPWPEIEIGQRKEETMVDDKNSIEVLIFGPGVMGSGLAQVFAQHGIRVGLVGRREASLRQGFERVEKSLEEGISKGVFSRAEAGQISKRIHGIVASPDFRGRVHDFPAVKLIIEAINEDFETKKEWLQEIDRDFPASVVLAMNTSSLDAEALGLGLLHPERLIWTHFFYPPQKNKTVELSLLSKTSATTWRNTTDILNQTRRQVIQLKKYRRGGAANVIFIGLILEAFRLLEEGYASSIIDEASRLACNTSFGLVTLLSAIGLKTCLSVALSFSQTGHPADPLFSAYDNFFSLPPRLHAWVKRGGEKSIEDFIQEIEGTGRDHSLDPLILELGRQRFQAVSFMTAAEVVEAGLIEPPDVDRLCQAAFGWPEGPFAMMNRLGLQTSLQMVTERMELSHRLEVNFPVPRNLIERAQKNEPWPLV